MQIILDVIDSMSSAPLPGATIAINGQAVGMTDSNGVYMLDSNGSEELTISYVGYSDYKIPAGILEGSGQIQMSRATDQLPTVTVTPSPKKSSALPWLLGAGLLFAVTDKKKQVSGTRKNNTGLIIGIGALGLGAVYLLSRRGVTTPAPTGLTTQQLIALRAQQANAPISSGGSGASSWLSAGASLVSSLKDLFGGSGGSDNTTPGYYGADPLPAPPPDYYAPIDPNEYYV